MMHEFSLIEEVVRLVRASAEEVGVDRVERVSLTVGSMSCAHPPALQSAFGLVTADDPLLATACLDITEEAVRIRCRDCGSESEIGKHEFICPGCDSTAVDVVAGQEITLDGYEGVQAEGDDQRGQGETGHSGSGGQR